MDRLFVSVLMARMDKITYHNKLTAYGLNQVNSKRFHCPKGLL